MTNNKHTEPCVEVEVVKRDVEHLIKDVNKLENNIKQQDASIKTLEKEMQDVKNVNTFLLKEVKEFLDVKNKIQNTILKYVSKIVVSTFIVGLIVLLINYKDLLLKFLKLG